MNSKRASGLKSHETDRTSLSLLERVKAEDAVAWQRLVDLYGPLVFSWCKRCSLTSEDCSDILQEVFATVAQKISGFRREKAGDTFRGWLRVVTRNQIRMHWRRHADQPQAVGGSTANAKLQELADEVLDERLAAATTEKRLLYARALELMKNEFERRTFEAFIQNTIDGRSVADVAAELNMTSGAVRQAKYKVLRRLRVELGDFLS